MLGMPSKALGIVQPISSSNGEILLIGTFSGRRSRRSKLVPLNQARNPLPTRATHPYLKPNTRTHGRPAITERAITERARSASGKTSSPMRCGGSEGGEMGGGRERRVGRWSEDWRRRGVIKGKKER